MPVGQAQVQAGRLLAQELGLAAEQRIPAAAPAALGILERGGPAPGQAQIDPLADAQGELSREAPRLGTIPSVAFLEPGIQGGDPGIGSPRPRW